MDKKKRAIIVSAAIFAVLLIVYIGFAIYFQSHFLPLTSLNGKNVSGMSKEAVEELITEEIGHYTLTILKRGDQKETLNGADISLEPEFGDSILKRLKEQNVFAWPSAFFTEKKIEEPTIVHFDRSKFQKAASGLECMKKKNQQAPKDAVCSEYTSEGYTVIPEEQGTTVEKEKLFAALEEAVCNLKESMSLEEEECYVKPDITAEDPKLTKLVDTLNQYTGVTITYDTGEEKEVLDGSVTSRWMEVKDGKVSISEEAVEAYVEELAASYNTAFREHTLKTSYGSLVTITNGDYGWKVDKEGEKEQLLKDIKSGKSLEREIVFSQRAADYGESDYGDTYVEINLTAQHLFFYKDGKLVVESDFVSGNSSKNYDTPTGIYGVTYKERDAVLRGENYATPVDYWMPFCNNVGMHDASWRSRFGGSIYKTSGSHGCINLPPGVAKQIFEQIEKGDPVIVYTLSGTESAAAAAEDAKRVVDLINSVGEVSLESEPAIAMARKLYELLSPKGQALVTNYDLLVAQEAQLANLKALYAAAGA